MKLFIFALALLGSLPASAAEDYAVWQDKRFVIAYNPNGRPEGISDTEVIDALVHAAAVWSPCGVQVVFGGFTGQSLDRLDGRNVIGWQAELPGLMALTLPQYLRRILLDADIRLNRGLIRDRDTLRRVVAHEMGHALGLFNHSGEPDSLMNERQFQARGIDTPSKADLALCQARYRW
ncbi:Matrixin [Formivibrio citricus]|uniref:Matrixin n=1 Tax=Formivibrio citricus TaxID=83765 RepID=A0A1I4WQU1_9NEIS|nr:matrixin family metalloprotease [Formivibrio citricus]SFN16224.1 Matrixin [Formivibrio citricus]